MNGFMLRASYAGENLVASNVSKNLTPRCMFSSMMDDRIESDFTNETPTKHNQVGGQGKRQILERKLLTYPIQSSVLTWKGRIQLLKLAKEYTDNQLDLSFLATQFPVSHAGIQKMMKTWKSHHVHSLSQIIRHNNAVLERWVSLSHFLSLFLNEPTEDFIATDGIMKHLPEDLSWIFEESKMHLLAYAHGNPSLPLYKEEEHLPSIPPSPREDNPGDFGRLAVRFGDPPWMKSKEILARFSSQQETIERHIASFGTLKGVENAPFHLPLTDSESSARFYSHMQLCARLLFRTSKPPLKLPNRVGLSFHKEFRLQNFF
ncbi:hypothetical protein FBUS_11330 [Fasciolopsis buskii]|uniref:Uncharacterized protein n=1 Tax=Fasciolopsis buskii TaxID=27845 RepID=A0A8E0VCR4_9TREM|nr:hypothetical protein FBUS_11330 [Fasciolopsis buski]